MNKKMIYAGIPVVALLFTIITPLLSALGFGVNVFDFLKSNGNVMLGLVFLLVPIAVAYCAYTDKYMKYAPYVLLLPFLWLLIWKSSNDILQFVSIGAGAWIYLILSVVEIVLVLKPDLLDNMLAKKQ